jgi:hypothetical protein
MSDCASTIGNIECTIGQFSLILFSLEKNVLHIERYSLDELAQDVTRLSKKDCNAHCLYTLHLGEKGQRVGCIDWYALDMEKLTISTYRGKANINYLLDWASLVIKEDGELQEFMKAPVKIREIFNIDLLSDMKDRKIRWFTSLAIKWGLEGHTLDINLILERKIQSVSCAVIPNCLIDDIDDLCTDMKKLDLINAGLLTLAPQDIVGTKTTGSFFSDCVEDDEQSSCACDSECSCQQSWYSSLYNTIAAQLAALKNAVCSCSGCC